MIEYLISVVTDILSGLFINYFLGSDTTKRTVEADINSTLSSLDSKDDVSSRFFFWISPNINMLVVLTVAPFVLIPLALIWFYIIYPPGKFYANVPLNRNNTAAVFDATIGVFRKRRHLRDYPIGKIYSK